MNLLMISGDRSILEGRRGAFWYTLQGLRTRWERIDVICPRPRTRPAASTSTPAGLQISAEGGVYFHPNPGGLLSQPRWIAKKGAELHAKHDYAAMTIHEYPPFYNGRGALRLAEKTGIPTLLEIHHIVGDPRPATAAEAAGRLLSRWRLPSEAKCATAVRTVNGGVKDTLVSWGVPKSKILVLPSFYLDREMLAGGDGVPQKYDCVCCCRLVPNKGMKNVLRALSRLPGRTLLVVGDGPDREALERRARELHIDDRVTFAGWLPAQQDVVRALRSARMFLMNSTSEGGPRSALEAMACGVPVVATRVGVMPDVIVEGENGLFTTGEPEDLARCIATLLQDPVRTRQMGERAQAVLSRFERGRLLQEYTDALRSLL